MVKEQIETRNPLSLLIDKEDLEISCDDRDLFITFLIETLHFILNQSTERKDVVIHSILYALNDYTVNELSARERAKELKISHGLIPHYIKEYKKQMNFDI